jgi:hypothetical protein
MPGFSFPPVGPLGLGSPPSRPSPSGRRYYDPLRLPLHHLRSLRFALDPRYLACTRSFVSLSARRRARCRPSRRLAAFVFRLAVPGPRRKELAVLSSSQATPVRTCPARRLRWCPFRLALASPGLLPSGAARPSAFPGSRRVILSDHNYEIFGAQSRGLHSRYTWLHTHPCRICMQVHYRFGGSPLRVGLVRHAVLTHWVTSTNFTASFPIPRFWV